MTKKSKKTFDYQTKRWGIKPIKNLITDFQGLELVFFKSDVSPYFSKAGLSVLDLGCGGGNIDGYLKNIHPNWKITGVDVSSNSLKIAKKTFPNISFKEASADNLPFENKSFDLVVGFDTLEHFANLGKVLNEVKRVLKRHGYFYVAIPLEKQFPTLYWLMYKMGWRGKKEFAGHVNFFDNNELISFFGKNGFGYIKHHFSNHLLFSFADIPYYLMQSFRGQEAVSFESKIYESRINLKKTGLGLFKKIVSGVTFFESYIFRNFPGGKGHYLFRKT